MEEIRICAFVDALGTSSIFLGDDSDKRNNMIKLIKRISNRNAAQSFNCQNMVFAVAGSPTPQITTFSDNIALSCTFNNIKSTLRVGNETKVIREHSGTFIQAMITQIISIVWEALRYGILFRGGICLGNLVHNNEIIAGDALVKAVILEKETKEARIEVQQEIMDLVDDGGEPLIDDMLKKYCFEEIDGKWFVKIFGYHELIFHDHNYFMEQEGLKIITDKRDVLKYYSKRIAEEYKHVLNDENKKTIAKWNWFLDDLERNFKTSEVWMDLDNSFDSMFGEILEKTSWTEKIHVR
jgi:hypothetical protein